KAGRQRREARKPQRYSVKQFGGTSANFVRDCEGVPKRVWLDPLACGPSQKGGAGSARIRESGPIENRSMTSAVSGRFPKKARGLVRLPTAEPWCPHHCLRVSARQLFGCYGPVELGSCRPTSVDLFPP